VVDRVEGTKGLPSPIRNRPQEKTTEAYAGGDVEKPAPQLLNCPRFGAANHPSQKFFGSCATNLREPATTSIMLEEQRVRRENHERNLLHVQDVLDRLTKNLAEESY